jgi:hypothetical protein
LDGTSVNLNGILEDGNADGGAEGEGCGRVVGTVDIFTDGETVGNEVGGTVLTRYEKLSELVVTVAELKLDDAL